MDFYVVPYGLVSLQWLNNHELTFFKNFFYTLHNFLPILNKFDFDNFDSKFVFLVFKSLK